MLRGQSESSASWQRPLWLPFSWQRKVSAFIRDPRVCRGTIWMGCNEGHDLLPTPQDQTTRSQQNQEEPSENVWQESFPFGRFSSLVGGISGRLRPVHEGWWFWAGPPPPIVLLREPQEGFLAQRKQTITSPPFLKENRSRTKEF